MWVGEGGPHNAGSPPCSVESMRWANFGTALWWVDALAQVAALGYEAFCRQDFVGADYGLCDCATGSPLPGYWASLLWSRLMGPGVLHVKGGKRGGVRGYAHCAAEAPGSGALLLVNLQGPAQVRVQGLAGDRVEFHLTSVQKPGLGNGTGLLGTLVELNGEPLHLLKDGSVPKVASLGRVVAEAQPILLKPHSFAFVLYNASQVPACLEQANALYT